MLTCGTDTSNKIFIQKERDINRLRRVDILVSVIFKTTNYMGNLAYEIFSFVKFVEPSAPRGFIDNLLMLYHRRVYNSFSLYYRNVTSANQFYSPFFFLMAYDSKIKIQSVSYNFHVPCRLL